ncbi:aminotransferase class IV [Salinarimonas sp.]|uniref:aminotransferase class IV n=1 Tax=Salinarimonas sp. TaxID=2766526 RepID=UPI0032D95BAF
MSGTVRVLAPLEVFETLRFDPDEGYVRLDLHLARLADSCAAFGLPLALDRLRSSLAARAPAGPARIRIGVAEGGAAPVIQAFDLAPDATAWRVAVHESRVDEGEIWRAHKTNRRELYDEAREALPEGLDEWLFLNGAGEVCEGSITNVFLRREGRLITPPVAAGALPGVLRRALIETGRAIVAPLSLSDLTGSPEGLFVGNSLRGLIPATLVSPGVSDRS